MKILDVIDEERPLLLRLPTEQSTLAKSYHTSPPVVAVVSDQDERGARRLTNVCLLLVVAILYGTLNVSLRGVYAMSEPPTASALSTARGWMAVLCFLPLIRGGISTSRCNNSSSNDTGDNSGTATDTGTAPLKKIYESRAMILVALELAAWDAGAQGLENIALVYVSSARVAFLSQLTVVLTPILSFMVGIRPRANVWWACGLAMVGLFLMSCTHNDDTSSSSHNADKPVSGDWIFALGLGDVLCLVGALSWSTYLIRMSAVSEMFPEVHLQSVKTFFQAAFYSCWCLGSWWVSGQSQWKGWENSLAAWVLLFYSAAGPGTLAVLLQQRAQTTVSATVTSVLLSLEPVFTALLGRLLLREETSLMEKMGGGCIIAAAVLVTRD